MGAQRRRHRAVPNSRIEALESRLLLSAGQLDSTYGTAGTVTLANNYLASVVSPANQLLLAGPVGLRGGTPDPGFRVTRFTSTGAADSTFGTGGTATITLPSPYTAWSTDFAAEALQSDGKIVIAGGVVNSSSREDYAIARLNADGSLDSTFGTDGFFFTTFASTGQSSATSIAIQSDGKIVVGGFTFTGSDHFAIIRLNPNGSTDTSFSGGIVAGTNSTAAYLRTIVIQPDGKILAVGQDGGLASKITQLVRLNTDGSFDSTFGSGGLDVIKSGAGAFPSGGFAIALLPSGSFFVKYGGSIMKVTASGGLDTSFGALGVLDTHLNSQDSLALESDGKFLVGGSLYMGNGLFDSVVQRLNPDGNVDWSFGSPIGADLGQGSDVQVYIQSDNKIVAVRSGDAFRLLPGTLATNPTVAFTLTGFSTYTAPGVPCSFTVSAEDVNGQRLTNFTGTVHFTSSDPKAVLPPDYPFTAADNGTHTFNATLKTIGSQSIFVSGPVDAVGSQTQITVHGVPSYDIPVPSSGFFNAVGVYDPLRNLVYIPTAQGTVERYNIATQSLLPPVVIASLAAGDQLGEGDITADSKYLYIPDRKIVNGTAWVHKIDLSTDSVKDIPLSVVGNNPPMTLRIAANGLALVTCVNQGPSLEIFQIDTSDDSVKMRADVPSRAGSEEMYFQRSVDRSLLVFKEGQGSTVIFTYDPKSDAFSTPVDLPFNTFDQYAVSRDGSRIAIQGDNQQLLIYDASFNSIATVNQWQHGTVLFDPTRDVLYKALPGTNGITAYGMSDWSALSAFPVANTVDGSTQLFASTDGKYLYEASGNLFGTPTDTPISNISDFPTAFANGPYTVAEGASVHLDSSGSYSVQFPITKIEWDTNYNGVSFNPSANGAQFSAAGVDGPSTRTIAVRITNGEGNSAIATTTLSVTDVPPKLTVSGPARAFFGTYTLSLSASDPGPDPILSWIIDWGDGTTPQSVTGNPSSVTHNYTKASGDGVFNIVAKAIDQDGTFTAPTLPIQVYKPASLASGVLTIYGGGSRDAFFISSDLNTITVTVGQLISSFLNVSVKSIVFAGGAESDYVVLESNLPQVTLNMGDGTNQAILYNNAKNDGPITINGGVGFNTVYTYPGASGNITFNGNANSKGNFVEVAGVSSGTPDAETQTMTSSSLTCVSASQNLSIGFSNVKSISTTANFAPVTFNVNVPTNISLQMRGYTASDVYNIAAAGGPVAITTYANGSPTATLNVTSPTRVDIALSGYQLRFNGTSGPDDFLLSTTTIADQNAFVSLLNVFQIWVNGGGGDDTLTLYRPTSWQTNFDGGTGNNSIIIFGQATITGSGIAYGSGQPELYFANVAQIEYLSDNGTQGLTNNGQTPVTVVATTPPDVSVLPVANAGGPYSSTEGALMTLDASASTATAGPLLSYRWSVTSSQGYSANLVGQKPTFSLRGLDGPETLQVALTVTDAAGNTAKTTSTVAVADTAPTAKFSSGGSVKLGSAGSVSFSAQSDPSVADTAAGFTYSYDFNNDGTFEITDSTTASATVPATYLATPGVHTIRGRIKDKDGGLTDYTTTITVTATTLASISGTVFADNNGNAKLDAGELGISGRKVYIDKNKNGIADAGEPTFTTGANGTFTFTGLAAGTYRVRDVLPTGWRRTSPTSGYFDVTVSAGQVVTKNFAETTRGLISGTVFKDANGNGIKDSTEVGLSGWVVFLDTNNNGKLDAGELSFTTGTNGAYSFVVAAGTYHVREVLKSGFKLTTPVGGSYTITLGSGKTATGKNFGNK